MYLFFRIYRNIQKDFGFKIIGMPYQNDLLFWEHPNFYKWNQYTQLQQYPVLIRLNVIFVGQRIFARQHGVEFCTGSTVF